MAKIKVGFGFDVHQLKENHPFVLGGVNLEHHAGAYGHSRLREWVLSGVTRHLATESRRCAFLSR